ncbi:MAG: hypothetical protein GEU26_06380 [Nitrososphaeraceae archaeon]|nr:hypothetical protein [Nitrososphaeraceae archaeon]
MSYLQTKGKKRIQYYDRCIEDALYTNVELAYLEIKNILEGEKYLDLKSKGKELSHDTLGNHLKWLEEYGHIQKYLCKHPSLKRRVCYSLTEAARKEREIEYEKNARPFLLTLLYLIRVYPYEQYPLTDDVIRSYKTAMGIDLLPDKLEKLQVTPEYTLYRPINGIQVIEVEHNIMKILDREMADRLEDAHDTNLEEYERIMDKEVIARESHFSYRIIGFSKDDIISLSESKNMKLDEGRVRKAFSIFEEKGIIMKKGFFNSEPIYGIRGSIYSLVTDCLLLKEELKKIMKEWWKNIDLPDPDERDWLRIFDENAAAFIEYCRRECKENSLYRETRAKEMKKPTEDMLKWYKEQVHHLKEVKYKKTLIKFDLPLINNFVTMCINPGFLNDFIKRVDSL